MMAESSTLNLAIKKTTMSQLHRVRFGASFAELVLITGARCCQTLHPVCVRCRANAQSIYIWMFLHVCASVGDCSHAAGGFSADLCIFAGLWLAVAQKPSRWTAEKPHWFHPSRNPFSWFPPPYPAQHLIKHLQGAMPTQFVIYQK